MFKKLTLVVLFILGIGSVRADLAHHWKLDEDTNAGATTVADSVGGNDGTINGAVTIEGVLGNGLYFDGSSTVEITGFSTDGLKSMTMTFWMNPDTGYEATGGYKRVISANDGWEVIMQPNSGLLGNNLYRTGGTYVQSTVAPPEGEWTHVGMTADLAPPGTGLMEIYINGVFDASMEDQVINDWAGGTFLMGYRAAGGGAHFEGSLDDVRIYNTVLTEEEVKASMGATAPELAELVAPEDAATDVVRDVVLSWTPGEFAATHNVYLGTSWDDVNDASADNPMDTLVSEGQDANTLDVGTLDFGQTYFWRVDEVNGAPDYTMFKGAVWSFTVEPYAYPVQPIAATASSSHEDTMGPERTIDGSGLNDLDQHSNIGTDMWLSGPGSSPAWIQYELDKVYKLHEMWVWNSNQVVEPFIGIGAKDVTVETSLDGQAWTAVENVPEFAQATGKSDYTANTVVDFNGTMARFIRLTINSGWGVSPQNGLSEVRIFQIPIQARQPKPANGAVDIAPDAVLTWRAGREAADHEVVLSSDEQAVIDNTAVIGTVSQTGFDLSTAGIELGTTYYWKVNEVNDAATPASVAGEVWRFSTPASIMVDGFETYDDNCQRIFFVWQDGFGHNGSENCGVAPYNGNNSGSIVGNASAPFAERIIVHSGAQSMPLAYEGNSEAQRNLNQDWTVGGAQTLVLFFYGDPQNTGKLYVKVNGSKVMYDGPADAITTPYWTQWNIDLASLGVNLQNVTQLTVGAEGGSGMVYIDDIQLYREPPAPAGEQLWIEAESAAITAPMKVYSDKTDATGGLYIGTDDFGNIGDQSDGVASFTFTVQGGTYKIYARVITADAGDSFWIRLPDAQLNTTPPAANNGWIRYNGIPLGDTWHWDDVHNDEDGSIPVQFTLSAGTHTLDVAWREDGALLDALVITDQL